jgi:hypothetical protein
MSAQYQFVFWNLENIFEFKTPLAGVTNFNERSGRILRGGLKHGVIERSVNWQPLYAR